MEFTDVLRALVAVYRSRTDELLPVYFLSPAVAQVARVVVYAGVAAVYAYLSATGRLARLRTDLRGAEVTPLGAGADGDAFQRWFEAAALAFERLVVPEVVVALGATVLVALVVFAVLYAVAAAAQLCCCLATLRDERGTTAAVAGARRHWRPLLGLAVLQSVAVALLTGLAAALVAAAATASPVAAIAAGLLVVLPWLVAVVVVRLVFVFAAAAVVVDRTGVRGGLDGGARFVRANPLWTAGYLLAAVGVIALIGSASAAGGPSGGAAGVLLGIVVTSPVLDLLKIALYADRAGGIDPPAPPAVTPFDQLRAGVRRGLGAAETFVLRNPGLHVVATLAFVGGGLAGWTLAGPYEGIVTASVEARLEDHAPLSAAVTFATNNTAVAVGSAASGLAFGVPSVAALLFNGALFGVLARLEVAPAVLAAFVAPHGVVEIPALLIAGALGLSLGGTGWRAATGDAGRADVAAALERAFWVLVGVAVMLAVAGLVEGLVSPYYFRALLGG
ncbi:stage II sporulation protein M [Halobacteriales archaeon QS_8_69_73]|nr:MAG: stage II sporulation protein M [Halobacteriales archaeon QS_8_69_73]